MRTEITQQRPLIQVEKNIPVPPRRYGPTHSKYPFATMGVGESFLFPPTIRFPWSSVRTARQRYAPKTFEYRKLPEGVRCWRTA